MRSYRVLGIMSGTSLDGVDLALCEFKEKAGKWEFEIIKAVTEKYPQDLSSQLRNVLNFRLKEILKLHRDWGLFVAERIKENFDLADIDLISSHGHTVFHKPDEKLNLQIGNHAIIAALTGKPTIFDFRSIDIALGGEGAPLVPAGEKYLFPDYKVFLNLGGFANISVHKAGKIIAYDIAPVNYALNYFARKIGLEYDKDGNAGKRGIIIPGLLAQLENLDFYKKQPPKSLSDHYFFDVFLPVVEKFANVSIYDLLRTVYEHIANRISHEINQLTENQVFVTGGGAHNTFLVQLLKQKSKAKIFIPDDQTVDFKESVIFAFLGLLRHLGKTNVLKSVTGASADNCGGAVFYPFQK